MQTLAVFLADRFKPHLCVFAWKSPSMAEKEIILVVGMEAFFPHDTTNTCDGRLDQPFSGVDVDRCCRYGDWAVIYYRQLADSNPDLGWEIEEPKGLLGTAVRGHA